MANSELHCTFYKDEDDVYEIKPISGQGFLLNHQTNKSSVLCPETRNITCQYMALQQLDAHHRMILRARGTVDNSAPKSMQSYRSVADRKKKYLWQQLPPFQLRSTTTMNHSSSDLDLRNSPTMCRDENLEDEESLNASSVNKGVQTGIPFSPFNSRTADKIAWYLEAVSQGELQSHFFNYNSPQSSASNHSGMQNSSAGNSSSKKKRIVKGDIMDWHKDRFLRAGKSAFAPRILANNSANSKVKGMRCYNPPFRKKKSGSSVNSSDTFESYEDEEEEEAEDNEEDFEEEESDIEEVQDDTASHEAPQMRHQSSKGNCSLNFTTKNAAQKSTSHQTLNSSFDLNRNEEDKYLNFLSKVTEDILKSGVYTDRAIQRAFEFHMQFHQNDEERSKLQLLLEQVLEGLQISNDETDDILTRRKHFSNMESLSLSRPTTPPEKEHSDVLSGLFRTRNLDSELRDQNTHESEESIAEAPLPDS